jgi:SAM-dependent methyltransferase
LEVLSSSAEAPSFKDESFDVITSFDVLEHLRLPSLAVKRLSGLLKPNGILVIRTPNLSGIGARMLNKAWFGYSDPTHISLGRRDAWLKLLEENGLTVEESFSDSLFFLILGENKVASSMAVLRYLPLFTLGLLSLMGFGLGMRYPSIGENLCVIARKSQD